MQISNQHPQLGLSTEENALPWQRCQSDGETQPLFQGTPCVMGEAQPLFLGALCRWEDTAPALKELPV